MENRKGTATKSYDIVYSDNTDTPVIIDHTTGERMPAIFFFNRTAFVVDIFNLNDKETVIKNIGQNIDVDFEYICRTLKKFTVWSVASDGGRISVDDNKITCTGGFAEKLHKSYYEQFINEIKDNSPFKIDKMDSFGVEITIDEKETLSNISARAVVYSEPFLKKEVSDQMAFYGSIFEEIHGSDYNPNHYTCKHERVYSNNIEYHSSNIIEIFNEFFDII